MNWHGRMPRSIRDCTEWSGHRGAGVRNLNLNDRGKNGCGKSVG